MPGNGLKYGHRDIVIRCNRNVASCAWQWTEKLTKRCRYVICDVLENLPLVPCIRLLKNEEEM